MHSTAGGPSVVTPTLKLRIPKASGQSQKKQATPQGIEDASSCLNLSFAKDQVHNKQSKGDIGSSINRELPASESDNNMPTGHGDDSFDATI